MPDSLPADPLDLLNAKQVAELLKIPVDVVYRDASAGRIPSVRLGRRRRFRRSDLEKAISGGGWAA